jgi:hypothetical protein
MMAVRQGIMKKLPPDVETRINKIIETSIEKHKKSNANNNNEPSYSWQNLQNDVRNAIQTEIAAIAEKEGKPDILSDFAQARPPANNVMAQIAPAQPAPIPNSSIASPAVPLGKAVTNIMASIPSGTVQVLDALTYAWNGPIDKSNVKFRKNFETQEQLFLMQSGSKVSTERELHRNFMIAVRNSMMDRLPPLVRDRIQDTIDTGMKKMGPNSNYSWDDLQPDVRDRIQEEKFNVLAETTACYIDHLEDQNDQIILEALHYSWGGNTQYVTTSALGGKGLPNWTVLFEENKDEARAGKTGKEAGTAAAAFSIAARRALRSRLTESGQQQYDAAYAKHKNDPNPDRVKLAMQNALQQSINAVSHGSPAVQPNSIAPPAGTRRVAEQAVAFNPPITEQNIVSAVSNGKELCKRLDTEQELLRGLRYCWRNKMVNPELERHDRYFSGFSSEIELLRVNIGRDDTAVKKFDDQIIDHLVSRLPESEKNAYSTALNQRENDRDPADSMQKWLQDRLDFKQAVLKKPAF